MHLLNFTFALKVSVIYFLTYFGGGVIVPIPETASFLKIVNIIGMYQYNMN